MLFFSESAYELPLFYINIQSKTMDFFKAKTLDIHFLKLFLHQQNAQKWGCLLRGLKTF